MPRIPPGTTVCRVTPDPTGQQADGLLELQAFGTRPADRLALSDWLAAAGVIHVAMESTGESWTPISRILEGSFTVCLVNAAHVKQVPGRTTDKADACWLATLMRDWLLPASFIPPAAQRDLRELTRYRTTLVQERGREVNRVPGVLERAHIKLAAVATNIFGVSGRADPSMMAELAKGRLRSQRPLLAQALTGLGRAHHRRWLTIQLPYLDCLNAEITRALMDLRGCEPAPPPAARAPPAELAPPAPPPQAPLTVAGAVSGLETIPGVNQRGAERLVAESGIDLGRFGTAKRCGSREC